MGAVLKREHLIKEISNNMSLPPNVARHALDTVLQTIADKLLRGERVSIYGFGAFDVIEADARDCHNPRTGEKVRIPQRKRIVFTPSTSLTRQVRES